MPDSKNLALLNKSLQWNSAAFENLSLVQLSEIYRLRQEVFIVEQNCPFPDIDGRDNQAQHLWATDTATNNTTVVAYLRILSPGVRYPEASIGRVVTAASERGSGTGKELMRRGVELCKALFPNSNIRIAAQQYLERFYSSFGFKVVSPPFLEDGIWHLEMLLSA